MTMHRKITQADQAEVARALLRQIVAAAELDRIAAVGACDAALDILAPAIPEAAPAFGRFSEDAQWWAEFAPDSAAVAMLAACLRRVTDWQVNTGKARKRALVAIWNTLDEAERTAFLEFVEPGPKAKA